MYRYILYTILYIAAKYLTKTKLNQSSINVENDSHAFNNGISLSRYWKNLNMRFI